MDPARDANVRDKCATCLLCLLQAYYITCVSLCTTFVVAVVIVIARWGPIMEETKRVYPNLDTWIEALLLIWRSSEKAKTWLAILRKGIGF